MLRGELNYGHEIAVRLASRQTICVRRYGTGYELYADTGSALRLLGLVLTISELRRLLEELEPTALVSDWDEFHGCWAALWEAM